MRYIILLFFFSLPVLSTHAQRMLIENGKVYIESFGVRSDLVVQNYFVKRYKMEDNSVRTVYHQGVGAPANILISGKYQIAKRDHLMYNQNFYVSSGFESPYDGRPGKPMRPLSDTTNQNGCFAYYENSDQSDKGQWRVPTINEYILMALYLTGYNTLPSITDFTYPSIQNDKKATFYYVTSTTYEGNVDEAYYFMWYPGFMPTITFHYAKTTGGRVRCIRDIE